MAPVALTISRGRLEPFFTENFKVGETHPVTDPLLAERVQLALATKKNFGGGGMRCFNPGMLIRYEQGDDRTDHQVCLRCLWVRTFTNGKRTATRALSKNGQAEFKSIYESLFGTIKKQTEEAE
jgi:hypothetical protein